MDFIEKFTRIVFTIILGALAAWAGVKVQWDRIGIETDAICFNQYKLVSELTNRTEYISASLVRRYAERCNLTDEQAGAELNEARAAVESASARGDGRGVFADVVAPAAMLPLDTGTRLPLPGGPEPDATDAAPPIPEGEGFVALGRVTTGVYAQVNFDRLDGQPATGDGAAPPAGTVLRARWEVNLRENTSVTTAGANPILGMIDKDECIRLSAPPEVQRGQFWARVARVACPA